ncbi:MAG: UbiX family flavin prenyltransferase [Candidatus Thermoplasmatota archaeon]|nr:UbiX family flavin prenyltransferase [Candidatus Thermoplasmatota archaeon]MBU1940574.1 UbiX family flavin prenyltransferase [Candidatus Thermoplasmatota archaeon]
MRVLLGISGASGCIYGIRMFEVLQKENHEIFLIVSDAGKEILGHEEGISFSELSKKAAATYANDNLLAGPASGSFLLDAMIIMPCSMKTLAAVANGYGDNLLARAALCQLKEGRPVVLVIRETPLELAGLRNMVAAREAGAIILPACPGFYHRPQSLSDLVDFIVGKVLDQLKIDNTLFKRWGQKS